MDTYRLCHSSGRHISGAPRPAPVESNDHWRTQLTDKMWIKIRVLHAGLVTIMIAVRFGLSRELIWKTLKNDKGSGMDENARLGQEEGAIRGWGK